MQLSKFFVININQFLFYYMIITAVQNERDRINCRRPSYEEPTQANGLSVVSLLNAELLSRKVIDEVSGKFKNLKTFYFCSWKVITFFIFVFILFFVVNFLLKRHSVFMVIYYCNTLLYTLIYTLLSISIYHKKLQLFNA